MGKLGITVGELRNTKEGGITDLKIATNLVRYAIRYDDDRVILKIKPSLVREALIKHIQSKQ